MTNNQLIAIFTMIEENAENIFDIYEALKEYEVEYKEMSISKIKPTIYDAYKLYCDNKNNIVEAVKYILEEVDFSEIAKEFNFKHLLAMLPEEYMSVIGQLIEENLE